MIEVDIFFVFYSNLVYTLIGYCRAEYCLATALCGSHVAGLVATEDKDILDTEHFMVSIHNSKDEFA